jgi:hypothetical protein
MGRVTNREEAIEATGWMLVNARQEREELYARGGAETVGQAACPHGSDEERAAIEVLYERLRRQGAGALTSLVRRVVPHRPAGRHPRLRCGP